MRSTYALSHLRQRAEELTEAYVTSGSEARYAELMEVQREIARRQGAALRAGQPLTMADLSDALVTLGRDRVTANELAVTLLTAVELDRSEEAADMIHRILTKAQGAS